MPAPFNVEKIRRHFDHLHERYRFAAVASIHLAGLENMREAMAWCEETSQDEDGCKFRRIAPPDQGWAKFEFENGRMAAEFRLRFG